MKRLFIVLVASLGACAKNEVRKPSSETAKATPTVPKGVSVFLTSELKGYLGPCGCSENMRGGIARAAFQIAEARKSQTAVFYFDAGNTLFERRVLPPETVPEQELKAAALASALKAMGLNGKRVADFDDVRGADFRKSLALPELKPEEPVVFEAQGIRLAVVSAPASETLVKAASQARAEGAQVVLVLLAEDWATALKVSSEPSLDADLVLVAGKGEGLAAENNRLLRSRVPLVQLQDRGRSLLRLDFAPNGEGRFAWLNTGAETERELAGLEQRIELLRAQVNEPSLAPELLALRKAKLEEIMTRREALASQGTPWPTGKNAYSARFIPLESSLPSLPAVDAIVTAFDREVGKLNVEWAKTHPSLCPPAGPQTAQFVGSQECRYCHEDAFALWEKSKHASSYAALEAKGKNFHLECIGCHVLGFKQPGGVCRIDLVKGRSHVGCESCHGPGSVHVATLTQDTIAKGNDSQQCQSCHDTTNSPHFNFQEYLAKILGPGHGQPLIPKAK